MSLALKRIRAIITDECLLKGIGAEHIELGCEHAEYLFEQNNNIISSIYAGISVAQGQEKRKKSNRIMLF